MKTIKERLEEYRDKLPPFSRAYDIISGIIAELDKQEPVDYIDIKLAATLIVKSCDNFGKFRQENPMAENFDVVEGFVEATIHSLLSRQRQSLAYLNRSSYTAPQPDNKELLRTIKDKVE